MFETGAVGPDRASLAVAIHSLKYIYIQDQLVDVMLVNVNYKSSTPTHFPNLYMKKIIISNYAL